MAPVFPNFDRFFNPANEGASLDAYDSKFNIVDNSDPTKKVAFQVSGVTAATTRTLTVPDASTTLVGTDATQTLTNKTINGPVGLRSVYDTGGAFATPVVLTAADSGKIILLDDAAGLDFTLPALTTAATDVGIVYEFRIITEVTSNSYRITAGNAADLFVGSIIMMDKDAATGDTNALISLFRPDVSDDDALTIGGTDDTTGSLVGGWFRFESLTTARWFVSGVLIGDGSMATVFA